MEKFYGKLGISSDDVFISDGSKPDLARLQFLFPDDVPVALQNPVYPAYVDNTVLSGKGGKFDTKTKKYEGIQYMDCLPSNNFFPSELPTSSTLIYFCSPNNPTGVASTRDQLQKLVDHVLATGSILIYDTAYRSGFVV